MNAQLNQRLKRLKTLPVFPTLLTAGNLACGITAVLCAAHYTPGNPAHQWMLFIGCCMVFVAMVFDMFDGKVARMTNTAGPFGAELDSLADVVSFGVAPAILVHRLVLGQPGVFAYGERLLWLVTVFYAVMAAIRLARYNVEHSDEATPWFRGLPSPGAAALVCGWVMFHQWAVLHPEKSMSAWLTESGLITSTAWSGLSSMDPFRWSLVGITVLSALLMVSTVRYPHAGNTLFGRIGFRPMILLMLVLGSLWMFDFPHVLFFGTTGYVAWGLFRGAYELWRNWRQGRNVLEDEDEAEADDLGEAR
ncbi:MAG: phosphatidylcholine/phosphatidylserine synthase [Planctomycetes bacterium]|nr:phosphatidylcholine/phosphatidylserine synthase [Planctomycetota bacterium]